MVIGGESKDIDKEVRKMNQIIKNCLSKLNYYSRLDDIKTTLREECEKATFPINEKEWGNMFDEILIQLSESKRR